MCKQTLITFEDRNVWWPEAWNPCPTARFTWSGVASSMGPRPWQTRVIMTPWPTPILAGTWELAPRTRSSAWASPGRSKTTTPDSATKDTKKHLTKVGNFWENDLSNSLDKLATRWGHRITPGSTAYSGYVVGTLSLLWSIACSAHTIAHHPSDTHCSHTIVYLTTLQLNLNRRCVWQGDVCDRERAGSRWGIARSRHLQAGQAGH